MVNVTLETSSGTKEMQIQRGEILRTAMLRRGVSPHNGRARLINCRGLGTCGTCAVEIEAADNTISEALEPNTRNTKEKIRLNFPPHGSSDQSQNLRLACQIQVFDDITVRKRTGFWDQPLQHLNWLKNTTQSFGLVSWSTYWIINLHKTKNHSIGHWIVRMWYDL